MQALILQSFISIYEPLHVILGPRTDVPNTLKTHATKTPYSLKCETAVVEEQILPKKGLENAQESQISPEIFTTYTTYDEGNYDAYGDDFTEEIIDDDSLYQQ